MTPENFCYWFQGWLELERPETITPEQVQEIKNHLDLVFTKVTPDIRLRESNTASEYKIYGDAKHITSYYPVAIQSTGIDPGMLELLKNMPIVDHAHANINNQLSSIDNCIYCHPELKTVDDDNMFKVNNDVQYGQFVPGSAIYPPGFTPPLSFYGEGRPPLSC